MKNEGPKLLNLKNEGNVGTHGLKKLQDGLWADYFLDAGTLLFYNRRSGKCCYIASLRCNKPVMTR